MYTEDFIYSHTHTHTLSLSHTHTHTHLSNSSSLPLPELLVDESVGKPLAADPDALQDAVAAQLVQHQVGVDQPGLLELVGDDAADEVWNGIPEGGHEIAQGGLVQLSHGHELAALLSLALLVVLALVVRPQACDEGLRGLAEELHYRVVQRVLVLVQPAFDCVANLEQGEGVDRVREGMGEEGGGEMGRKK